MQSLIAFHGKEKVKEKYLKRVQKHYEMDEIVQGIYWENGKGCAVGCTVQKDSNAHQAMQKELGIPEDLAHLEDWIFEGLTNGEAKEFPLRFLNAITSGADLTKVTLRFKIWLLADKHNGVIQWANDETKKIIKQIVKLQKQELAGKEVDYSAAYSAARSAAESAESAARSAAESAGSAARSAAESAESAARSAAESAESAARSAAWSARSAAWSAARSAAWSAESAHYKKMADKLISLLKQAK